MKVLLACFWNFGTTAVCSSLQFHFPNSGFTPTIVFPLFPGDPKTKPPSFVIHKRNRPRHRRETKRNYRSNFTSPKLAHPVFSTPCILQPPPLSSRPSGTRIARCVPPNSRGRMQTGPYLLFTRDGKNAHEAAVPGLGGLWEFPQSGYPM